MVTAITGLIGSGKSSICNILRKNGKTVIDCDKINAELLQTDEYLEDIKEVFPYAFANGEFVKALLAERIFSDEEERKKLDSLSHPRIIARLEELLSFSNEDTFVEIPLLKEEYLHLFDRVIVVVADKGVRIERIMKRNSLTYQEAVDRIASQDDYELNFSSAVIISNERTETALEEELARLNII